MRVDILLSALVGASSALGMVMKISATTMEYDWEVTGWDAGCVKGNCSYAFQISGAQNLTSRPAIPAFVADCGGNSEGSSYRLCRRLDHEKTDAIIVSKLLPGNSNFNMTNSTHPAMIQVSLRYTDLESPTTWWNFTGHATTIYNQPVAPPQNFTITPNEIIGVA
ncbi:hypothetical protein GGS21DRAFT_525295 [Xylaria nigripes]|nr:hypothetical protein GGS21DRAFT_525295 [Xylaria nigripes]